jgi:hypothetical protein
LPILIHVILNESDMKEARLRGGTTGFHPDWRLAIAVCDGVRCAEFRLP